MIIEVKKTLYGAKIKEAMDLLRQFWREVAEVGQPKTGLLNDAWRALFKQHLPAVAEINNLPFHQEMIYHSLLVEAVLPLRVVFGYEGYVDEYGLREGFVGYLNEIAAQPPEVRTRFNINAFPNLIGFVRLLWLDSLPDLVRADLPVEDLMEWLVSKHPRRNQEFRIFSAKMGLF